MELLDRAGVATISGTSFGAFGEGYLRFSYAASTEAIQEACRRIRDMLVRLRPAQRAAALQAVADRA